MDHYSPKDDMWRRTDIEVSLIPPFHIQTTSDQVKPLAIAHRTTVPLKPRWLIVLLLMAIPINVRLFVADIEFNPIEAVLAFLGVVAFLEVLLRRGIREKLHLNGLASFYLLNFFFIGIQLLTMVNAYSWQAVAWGVVKWIEIIVISTIVYLFAHDSRRWKYLYWFLFFLLVVQLAFGLLKFFTGDEITLRATGPVTERIRLGYHSAAAFVLLIPFWASRWSKLLSVFIVAVSVLSASRQSWIEITTGWLVALALWRSVRTHDGGKLAYVVLGGLVAAIVLFVPTLRHIMEYRILRIYIHLTGGYDPSTMERLGLLKTSWQAFTEEPILGIGVGNFSEYLVRKGIPFFVMHPSRVDILVPHNLYFQFLAETGALGFLLFMGILIWLMRKSWQIRRELEHDISVYRYSFGVFLCLITMFISFMFGYISGQTRVVIGLLFGLVISSDRLVQSAEIVSDDL